MKIPVQCGAYRLPADRPAVMGIVNLTPDSFSGDGVAADAAAALAHAEFQLRAGADMLDLGAESSRPGARPVPEDEELARLLPVMAEVTRWGVPISVDTYKPAVMRAAVAAGAAMINDINGFRAPGALAAVAESDCALCLMHMQGEPGTMQAAPAYDDVVAEVAGFFARRLDDCAASGIDPARVVLDPGFGFGKTLDHNRALFQHLPAMAVAGRPVLVGVSRKSMLGAITGRPVDARVPASLAAAVLAAERGAAILRVHDVAATRDAFAVWQALR